MLGAIMRAIRRIFSALRRILGGLFGGGAPELPSTEFEEVVDEQVEELRQDLSVKRQPQAPTPTGLGGRVYAYASADYSARSSCDLDGIPDHVALTLLSLSRRELARLATAGPAVCGRWAKGEKTGLVGVPPCRAALPTHQTRVSLPRSLKAAGPHQCPLHGLLERLEDLGELPVLFHAAIGTELGPGRLVRPAQAAVSQVSAGSTTVPRCAKI
ncbi:hypothetical protein [Tianweitania sediminis]|uniref:Uncharacterized protein n=1 Tax=Tianweitania sediminis TaxID=1502156 RepID=A0A8J7R3L2_9HYPH|nr:hypothetical protein [Tianweitania sediminis]MBP0439921.1 hypothetical protein [Tianweitania sediminis]